MDTRRGEHGPQTPHAQAPQRPQLVQPVDEEVPAPEEEHTPAAPGIYTSEELAQINTNAAVLDNELQRQQHLWQAAQDTRQGILPAVRAFVELLMPQARIKEELASEIEGLRAHLSGVKQEHEEALAALATQATEAQSAHQAALAVLDKDYKQALEQRRARQRGVQEQLQRLEEEAQTQHVQHAATLAAEEEKHAQAMQALREERDGVTAQIAELHATRTQLAQQLQQQLAGLSAPRSTA